jgi:Protein of unknown function (DUF3761)
MRLIALLALAAAAAAVFAFSRVSGKTQCQETPGYYINSDGLEVHRPGCATTHQDGETAICNDGSHSFSKHRWGTCNYHGGVAKWE